MNKLQANKQMLSALLYWVSERESIRLKKERGLLAPWTDDPIFQTYRFCNVRRRDDRVSRWLRANVVTGANMLCMESFVSFTGFCRWNNWPPTIKAVLDEKLFPTRTMDWNRVAKVVEAYKSTGKKAWTGAYMIKSAREGGPKSEFVVGVARSLISILPVLEKASTRKEVWEAIIQLPYWGRFMAGQVVDDWTWVPLLSASKDLYTWAPQGPGSIRGFNRMLGLPLGTRHSEAVWCELLQDWRAFVIAELGPKYKDVTLMDFQNVMCETDKYLRVKNGEGRPRAKYAPETAF